MSDPPPDTPGQLLIDAMQDYRDRFGQGIASLMCPPERYPELTAALRGATAPLDDATIDRLCGRTGAGRTPGALI